MSYRLSTSKNGVALLTGRDIPAAISALERGSVSTAREMLALRAELALMRSENDSLRSRVNTIESDYSKLRLWVTTLTERDE